jgi:ankyrin repeat protein
MYRQMLARIDARGIKLLQVVFYAVRPMTIDELRFAVAIEPDMADLDCDLDLPFSPSFLDSALGLLVVEHDWTGHIVRFSHLTIKDYLSAHSSEYIPDGHILLARITLTYLRFTSLSSEAGRKRFLRDGDLFPFFKYATYNWGHHVREVDKDVNICSLARQFLLSDLFSESYNLRCRNRGAPIRWLTACQSPLHEACYFGLHAIIVDLLTSGQNINALDSHGMTPLQYAIQKGHFKVVQNLLGVPNIDGTIRDKWGNSPIHHASAVGQTDIVGILLQSSVWQINLQNERGKTPLHLAADNGHKAVVHLLLNDPRIQSCLVDENAETPLHLAARRGDTDIVRALFSCFDMDVNGRNLNGWTALTIAVIQGITEIVEMLLAHRDIDIDASRVAEPGFLEFSMVDSYSGRAYWMLPHDLLRRLGLVSESLFAASCEGDTDAVLALINISEPSIQPNSRYGEDQVTALYKAAQRGHSGVVEALLQHPDVEINLADRNGWMALMIAANQGHSDVVKALVQHPNISVNSLNHLGWTALTEAVDEGHAEIVELLLSHIDISIAASRVAEPEFWELTSDDGWNLSKKHITLPHNLRLKLGIWWDELTDFEIEMFSSSPY